MHFYNTDKCLLFQCWKRSLQKSTFWQKAASGLIYRHSLRRNEAKNVGVCKAGLRYLSPQRTAKTRDEGCGQSSSSTFCGPSVHFQGLVSMVTQSVQSSGLSFSSAPVQPESWAQVHLLGQLLLLFFICLWSRRERLQLQRRRSGISAPQRLSVVCCKACLSLSPYHPLPLLKTGRVYPVGPGHYESNQASFLSLL